MLTLFGIEKIQVWIRPGRRVKVDDIFSTRAYVNALEQAVAASLRNSNGRVGKFNVIVDGHDFSWGLMPSLHQLKVFVTMLQDHFPDRLGIIMLTNLGRVGEFVVGIIKPIISEEGKRNITFSRQHRFLASHNKLDFYSTVRQKIIVLPRVEKERRVMLKAVVGVNNIPKWLGGRDGYDFDSKIYYSDTIVLSDEEATQYAKTMPYHA